MADRNMEQLRKATEVIGYRQFHSDDFLIARGLRWLAERGTVEINHHPEGFSLSCVAKTGVSGASIVYEYLGDAVAECILNVYSVPTKPCVVCGKRLEPVADRWDEYQPHKGCEVRIVGAFGSELFDNHVNDTVFRGVICDDCAVGFIGKME